MSSFDPTKPVQTRDGRKARIIATDAKLTDGRSIIALVERTNGGEMARYVYEDGSWFGSYVTDPSDLINVPEETVEYRTVALGERAALQPYGRGCSVLSIGCVPSATEAGARELVYNSWDGIAKITTVDGKLTGLEFIPA